MNKEDKELLLKDLCGRLPYGVKCHIGDSKPYTLSSVSDDYDGILIRFKEQKNGFNMEVYLSECMPYLFPLSSMTEEIMDEIYNNTGVYDIDIDSPVHIEVGTTFEDLTKIINILYKHHIDYLGLIPMGLAIDATGLNIY